MRSVTTVTAGYAAFVLLIAGIIMNRVADMNVLLSAYDQCRSGKDWKYSAQKYEAAALLETNRLLGKIENGSYRPSKCSEFILHERGHVRDVKAPIFVDRIAAKAHNQAVLLPELRKKIIYDNGSSMKNRGNDFAKRRFETHVRKHFRQRGDNGGYVLFADFTKYFDNIPHKLLKEQFHELIDSPEENALTDVFIDSYRVDVSYMTDEEFAGAMNVPYNSLEHVGYSGAGEKTLEKSVNIGTETSQSAGVYLPHRIDNYFKIVRGEKYYARYSDDLYIINDDKELLEQYRGDLLRMAKELGIFINPKKTRIVPLNEPFIWLKTEYILIESGRLIRMMPHDAIARERRRIKKYAKLIAGGRITKKESDDWYRSWRRNASLSYDCYKAIGDMDKFYVALIGRFERPPASRRRKRSGKSVRRRRRIDRLRREHKHDKTENHFKVMVPCDGFEDAPPWDNQQDSGADRGGDR